MVRSFRCFAFCLFVLSIPYSIKAQSHVSRIGYVTQLGQPASFLLNQQQVITTPSTTLVSHMTNPPTEEDFSINRISVGGRVMVSGVEDKQTHVITARRIELVEGGSLSHLSGEGIEDRAPGLTKDGTGWRGKVYADGYEISVDPKTKIQLPQGTAAPNTLNPSLWIVYQAERQRDGSLLASQLRFVTDENMADEQKFRAANDFKIELPDYAKQQPGKVHFFLQTYHILPDRRLQDAVNTFGQKLVPKWQRELPDSDPAKIHFRFFILDKSKGLNRTLSNDTGTVLIPSQVLTKLENEAQLASLLSADIAGAINSDTYRSRSHKHAQEAIDIGLMAVPYGFAGQMANGAAFSAYYWTPLIEHEYRVGLRYVIAAGYDPREASIALQRLTAKYSDLTAGKPLPPLANYVDAELGFDYMGMDFPALRKGETEYASLVKITFAADPKLKKEGKTRLADDDESLVPSYPTYK